MPSQAYENKPQKLLSWEERIAELVRRWNVKIDQAYRSESRLIWYQIKYGINTSGIDTTRINGINTSGISVLILSNW